MNDVASAAEAAGRARSWLTEKALPLWSTRGFDRERGRFHERLAFDGSPLPQPGYRVMVQARQIATFAQVTLLGWFDGAAVAERAYASMVETSCRADGREGWVFSIDAAGQPRDVTRDLYGHAFVLYALAWMHRLTGSRAPVALAHDTLDWIETGMVGVGSGFRDAVPERDAFRRQNPHMHLLEAVLALWEATGDDRFAASATALTDLFAGHLLGPRGVVLELFDVDWRPIEASGRNIVEPGHQFEWVWLLRWYQRLSGRSFDGHLQRLLDHALTYGVRVDTGIVIDTVDETGNAVGPITAKLDSRRGLEGSCGRARTPAPSDGVARHRPPRRDHDDVCSAPARRRMDRPCRPTRHCDRGLYAREHALPPDGCDLGGEPGVPVRAARSVRKAIGRRRRRRRDRSARRCDHAPKRRDAAEPEQFETFR